MQLSTLLSSLSALFKRDELSRSCQAVSKKIDKYVIPEIHNLERVFGAYKPKSDAYKELSGICRKSTGESDVLRAVDKAMRNALVLLDRVEEGAGKLFSEEEVTEAMSFKKATYLQLVATITFTADYSLKMLNWILANELITSGDASEIKELFSQSEIDYIKNQAVVFFNLIDTLTTNAASLEKAIDSLPEVVVNQNSEAALHNSLGTKADPLMLNRLVLPVKVSVKWNPFYLIGTMVADWQVRAYKATEEEVKLLQMRRLRLDQLRAGKQDPRLEAEIEHLAARIQQLNYELDQAREAYGV